MNIDPAEFCRMVDNHIERHGAAPTIVVDGQGVKLMTVEQVKLLVNRLPTPDFSALLLPTDRINRIAKLLPPAGIVNSNIRPVSTILEFNPPDLPPEFQPEVETSQHPAVIAALAKRARKNAKRLKAIK